MPTYTTVVYQDDQVNATGLQVPAEIIAALGKGKRPPVKITVNGFTYRTTVAVMGGAYWVPLSAERRDAAGVRAGETVQVTIEVDSQPRTVEVPADLAAALAQKPGAAQAFDSLSYSQRKEHVRQVESAKAAETRQRRIAAIVEKVDPGG
jgi:hypothetical protein